MMKVRNDVHDHSPIKRQKKKNQHNTKLINSNRTKHTVVRTQRPGPLTKTWKMPELTPMTIRKIDKSRETENKRKIVGIPKVGSNEAIEIVEILE